MSACEDIVKEYVGKVAGLEDALAQPSMPQEILGITVDRFMPVKIVAGVQVYLGIVLRATKHSILLLDIKGSLAAVKLSKIMSIELMDCARYVIARAQYKSKFKMK